MVETENEHKEQKVSFTNCFLFWGYQLSPPHGRNNYVPEHVSKYILQNAGDRVYLSYQEHNSSVNNL